MPLPTDPVVLLPGKTLTLADIHELLPQATRLDGDKLIVRRTIAFRRVTKLKAAPKALENSTPKTISNEPLR